MTDNPIKTKSKRLTLSPQEWVVRGIDLCRQAGRKDIEWVVFDGKPVIRWVKTSYRMLQDTWANRMDVMDRRGQPMSESDTFKLNTELEKLGATARYRSDGSRYLLTRERAA